MREVQFIEQIVHECINLKYIHTFGATDVLERVFYYLT